MNKAKYQALVGSLNYAVSSTRPDLALSLGAISQFRSNPGEEHWVAAKRMLRYIKGKVNYRICYNGNKEVDIKLKGFVDADWGTNPNGRRSQSELCILSLWWCYKLGFKKTTDCNIIFNRAEYVAASFCFQELIWLRALLNDLNLKQEQPTVLNEDNQGVIALSKSPKYHSRTIHIDIKYHFIREKIKNIEVILYYCRSEA